MSDMTIVVPRIDDTNVAAGLRAITAQLQQITGEGPLGVLGGEHGYGVEYENDTFMMHPFCWCERTDCPWCLECECPEDAEIYFVGGKRVAFEEYSVEYDRTGNENREWKVDRDLQCGNCKKRDSVGFAPNFLFKPTGAEVRWYKYIGRSMEVEGELPTDFHSVCVASVISAVPGE